MNKAGDIKDGHVGSLEITVLLVITMSLKVLLTFPSTVIIVSLQAGWLFSLMLTVNGLIIFYIINKLFERFPNSSLDEINNKVLGNWLGRIANLTIIVFLCLYILTYLREFAELIISSILPTTPISVVMGIFLLAVVYGSYLGIETMTRAIFLIYPFLFFGFLLLYLLALPDVDFARLFPLLGSGLKKVSIASVISLSRFGEGIILLGTLIPFIRDKKNIKKVGYISIFFTGITFTLTVLIYFLIFGIPSSITTGVFPLFQLARIIRVSTFLERLESIFVFVWIFTALSCLRACFYGLNIIIARQLKLTVYRPLLFATGILIYTMSFLPPNFLSVTSIEFNIIRKYGAIPSVVIPIFVLIVAKFRGLKEVAQNEE